MPCREIEHDLNVPPGRILRLRILDETGAVPEVGEVLEVGEVEEDTNVPRVKLDPLVDHAAGGW